MNSVNIWSTPLVRSTDVVDTDTLNELRELVVREDLKQRGTCIGTFNASKTESNLLILGDLVLKSLHKAIIDMEIAMLRALNLDLGKIPPGVLAEAWGVVYRDWGCHRVHSHHDAAWSGVLYVDMGDSDTTSGQIEFLDPRRAAGARTLDDPYTIQLKPTDGEMILFPSWLEHWVTPHRGTRPRIVIAFNIGYEA